MGLPAAKQGDTVVATDMHMVQPPPPATPVLLPHPFAGVFDGGLSSDVRIMGRPAATQDSTATNSPPHVPSGGSFVKPPSNRATVTLGSPTVSINGKPAARNGDPAMTCNDPSDLPVGTVTATGTVLIG
jgi:uncharacterized Zn-binding protein involved in type VI secretion